jgi:hypothetical protein
MLLSPSLSLTGLKMIDPGKMALQTMIVALLDRSVNGQTLKAHLLPNTPQTTSGHWLSVNDDLFIHFVQMNGRPAVFRHRYPARCGCRFGSKC